MGTSCHQVLRARCSAPHCRRPPVLLNTDKGATMPDRASHAAKQVERHHFLLANRCAIITVFFDFFDFFDSESQGTIYQHRLIPLTYRHLSSLNKTHLMHRSVLSQDISYTVVATSLSPRFGPSEKGSLAGELGILGQKNRMGRGQRTF